MTFHWLSNIVFSHGVGMEGPLFTFTCLDSWWVFFAVFVLVLLKWLLRDHDEHPHNPRNFTNKDTTNGNG